MPDAFPRLAAQLMAEAGADLVLGHHPHAIQGLAAAGGETLIAFSLGNFIFDQARAITTESMILRVEASADGVFSWEITPVRIEDARPRVAEGTGDGAASKAKILDLSAHLQLKPLP